MAEVHPANTTNAVDLTFDTELAGNVPSTPYQPPAVAITAPGNGALFRAGSSIPIAAHAFDPDADLSAMNVFLDGVLLSTTTQPSFSTVIQVPSVGGHRVSVEAQDNFGHRARMESVFTVISNLLPAVNLITPQGQTYQTGAPVPLAANAIDPDGSVARVDFYVRQHMRFDAPELPVGTDLSLPFTALATNLAAGHYLAYAVATDNQGARGYSISGYFTVAPATGLPFV